jgi:hypothetical protein
VKTPNNPNGIIHIQKINTVDQLAYLFIKGLVEAKFTPLRDKLVGWDFQDIDANRQSRGSVARVNLVPLSVGSSVMLEIVETVGAPILASQHPFMDRRTYFR